MTKDCTFAHFCDSSSSLTRRSPTTVRVSFKYKHREGLVRMSIVAGKDFATHSTRTVVEARRIIELSSSLLSLLSK
ncbi:Signal recognition particle 9 kDa protein, putative [Ostreococcus lucimarinus CCE9901]|uniref:Signal recognition particle 9 kDa protein, putative n=1 Tax=Ostreococcus lucimarinus (strain CCE9901) TaxID=436017 RepID=A4RST4_OSTLU|nr:Signal recognition particle 9 kDa protein, putative [Ostreococcus lucimarinus CCE9901]ABO94486.1 Signal recognition particle 9 kDa protein, putative [Ostreococcus lucimarinus CCE9901]|eukprot:XP_001416193.1 Signal recognition particle 9 kDa protein, putative [Ostreococcus lucimarinus CCE9901]